MINRLLLPLAAFLLIGFFAVCCTEPAPETNLYGVLEPMPAQSDTVDAGFRDVNYWVDGDSLFCITGLVDNKRPEWQKIWIKVQLLDAENRPVKVRGRSELVLRAFSEAIPPLGASSFFYSVPVEKLSARPDSCVLSGAAAQIVPAGPILVVSGQSNVKAFVGADTSGRQEQEAGWLISCDMDNPLPVPSKHPRLNVLIYGLDRKLWFSQVLNPEDTLQQSVRLSPPGPIPAAGKANAYFQVSYEELPAKLQEIRIGFVDVLLFDARGTEAAVPADDK